MAEVYLPSNQIEIFPSVLRDKGHQVESRFIDVENTKRFHRFTLGGENIVLSTIEEVNANNYNGTLEFFINGCYVKVLEIESLSSLYDGRTSAQIYAEILVDDVDGIVGRDENDKYLGVRFVAVVGDKPYAPPQGYNSLLIGRVIFFSDPTKIRFVSLNNQVVIDGGDK